MEVQRSSKQKVMSTLRNNSKDGAPVSFMEFEYFDEDTTEQTQVVLNDDNSEETQNKMESDVEDICRESASHEKLKETAKTTANLDIKYHGKEISVAVSDFALVHIGSDCKVSKSLSCTFDVCRKNYYSSSYEENSAEKDGAPVSSDVEFEDIHEDAKKQTRVVLNDNNSEESQKNMESTSDVDVTGRDSASHEKPEVTAKTTAKVEFKYHETEMSLVVLGFPAVQFGSDCKVSKSRNCTCDVCSKNYYSSSDEENSANTLNIEEVDADSHAHVDFSKRETTCSKMCDSVMPVIPKRGCMNTSEYDSVITNLKELQRKGDFAGHEQMVEIQMAKLRLEADPDMEASLNIERAMALYFQNNIKDAKNNLKKVKKQEQQLENPGILVGRALNLLTAIYKYQGKFGKAMQCVEMANTCLEGQDSPADKAELYHSYGALITAMPVATKPGTSKATKKEAYKAYEMAVDTGNHKFKEYVHVKMAALLLESRSKAERTVPFVSKEDVLKAKEHLDFEEGKSLSLGTEIKFLLLRSDQYLCEGNVAMAMEKAQEANELIQLRGFQLEFVPAKTRIEYLSAIQKQEKKGRWISEFCCTNDDLSHTTDNESAHSE